MCRCWAFGPMGPQIDRRRVLRWVGAAALGLALPPPLRAAEKTLPKPGNVLSPDAALERLMAGNQRYVDGLMRRHDFSHEREALSKGQNPFAGVLGCADSRVSPDYAFDTTRGDLFVCRIAGNFADDDTIASFEYAVQELHTPLLVVLGHQNCGAVKAAIHSIRDGVSLPGHMPLLVDAIGPAVSAALGEPGDTLDHAIALNVRQTVDRLRAATPILSRSVAAKKLKVVGALYHLATGHVELLS